MSDHSSNKETSIIITGATSLIGRFLLPLLRANKYQIHALSRSKINVTSDEWHHYDGSLKSTKPAIKNADILIHLGPLYSLPNVVDEFASMGGKKIIAFCSTSRFSKLNSAVEAEREVAKKLSSAEESVIAKCSDHNLSWTIFRPTLIYGAGLDQNVSSIANFIKRFGFFPLVGKGSGLRQPVHAEDLATACITILNSEKISVQSNNSAYNLIGGETLTYKEMVERIFLALDKNPRFISLPLPLFRTAMKCISIIPAFSHITPDMADRMNKDLCFDSEEAIKDFGYQSRRFNPQQKDLDSRLN